MCNCTYTGVQRWNCESFPFNCINKEGNNMKIDENYVLMESSPIIVFLGNTFDQWWDTWESYVVLPQPKKYPANCILDL